MRRDGSRVTRRGIQIAPAVADVCFGLIQLTLGAGLLHRRTVRWALAASVLWALSVWYLGEGLGGLGGGQASLLTGAPGSARGVTPTPAEGLWSR